MLGIFGAVRDGFNYMVYYLSTLFSWFLLMIWRGLAHIIRIVEDLFNVFAGTRNVQNPDGNTGNFVEMLIGDETVRQIFYSLMGIAAILLIFFTILQLVRNQYREKNGGNPYHTVFKMIKGMVLFMFITAAVMVGLFTSGVIFTVLRDATSGGQGVGVTGQIWRMKSENANRIREGVDDGFFLGSINQERDDMITERNRGVNFMLQRTHYGGLQFAPVGEAGYFPQFRIQAGQQDWMQVWQANFARYTNFQERTVIRHERQWTGPFPAPGTEPPNWGGTGLDIWYTLGGAPLGDDELGWEASTTMEDIVTPTMTHHTGALATTVFHVMNTNQGLNKFYRAGQAPTAPQWTNTDAARTGVWHALNQIAIEFDRIRNYAELTGDDIREFDRYFSGTPGAPERTEHHDHIGTPSTNTTPFYTHTTQTITQRRATHQTASHEILNVNATRNAEGHVGPSGGTLSDITHINPILDNGFRPPQTGGHMPGGSEPPKVPVWSALGMPPSPSGGEALAEWRYTLSRRIDIEISRREPLYFLWEFVSEDNPRNRNRGYFHYTTMFVTRNFYYLPELDFILPMIALVIAFGVFVNFAFALIQRAAELAVLYMISPLTLAFFPFDDGQSFKNAFVGPFYKKTISIFAVVISMNLFFVILPVLNGFTWFPSPNTGANAAAPYNAPTALTNCDDFVITNCAELFANHKLSTEPLNTQNATPSAPGLALRNAMADVFVLMAILGMLPALRTTVQVALGADNLADKKVGQVFKDSMANTFGQTGMTDIFNKDSTIRKITGKANQIRAINKQRRMAHGKDQGLFSKAQRKLYGAFGATKLGKALSTAKQNINAAVDKNVLAKGVRGALKGVTYPIRLGLDPQARDRMATQISKLRSGFSKAMQQFHMWEGGGMWGTLAQQGLGALHKAGSENWGTVYAMNTFADWKKKQGEFAEKLGEIEAHKHETKLMGQNELMKKLDQAYKMWADENGIAEKDLNESSFSQFFGQLGNLAAEGNSKVNEFNDALITEIFGAHNLTNDPEKMAAIAQALRGGEIDQAGLNALLAGTGLSSANHDDVMTRSKNIFADQYGDVFKDWAKANGILQGDENKAKYDKAMELVNANNLNALLIENDGELLLTPDQLDKLKDAIKAAGGDSELSKMRKVADMRGMLLGENGIMAKKAEYTNKWGIDSGTMDKAIFMYMDAYGSSGRVAQATRAGDTKGAEELAKVSNKMYEAFTTSVINPWVTYGQSEWSKYTHDFGGQYAVKIAKEMYKSMNWVVGRLGDDMKRMLENEPAYYNAVESGNFQNYGRMLTRMSETRGEAGEELGFSDAFIEKVRTMNTQQLQDLKDLGTLYQSMVGNANGPLSGNNWDAEMNRFAAILQVGMRDAMMETLNKARDMAGQQEFAAITKIDQTVGELEANLKVLADKGITVRAIDKENNFNNAGAMEDAVQGLSAYLASDKGRVDPEKRTLENLMKELRGYTGHMAEASRHDKMQDKIFNEIQKWMTMNKRAQILGFRLGATTQK